MSVADLAYQMTANTVMRRSSPVVRQFVRGCDGKVRYGNPRTACRGPYAASVYRCKFCGGWHATSRRRFE
jgi:hypothetical protein